MTEKTTTDQERRVRTLVARSIWQAQQEKGGDAEAAKAKWQEERPEMVKVAARAIRLMEARGISLELAEEKSPE